MQKLIITVTNLAPVGQVKVFEAGDELPAHEIGITFRSCGGPKSSDILCAGKAFYDTLVRLRA